MKKDDTERFYDRNEAGLALAQKLMHYKGSEAIVIGVPRGGVPVAFVVAMELRLPLEIILVKKLGHPNNKEYAIGAVSLTDRLIVNDENVSESYIESETRTLRERLMEMERKFCKDRKPVALANKTVILVDDGIATGSTLLATIRLLRKSKVQRIVLAVPVASETALNKVAAAVDECICLLTPDYFTGVGAFYEDFSQTSDEEVAELLQLAQRNAA